MGAATVRAIVAGLFEGAGDALKSSGGALRNHYVPPDPYDIYPKASGKRAALPEIPSLMPLALEQLDLRGYDLVISSESGPAKGVITRAITPHLLLPFSHAGHSGIFIKTIWNPPER